MRTETSLLLPPVVFVLVFALGMGEVSAQAIGVAPSDPTISVGRTQQFTANGIDTATAVEAGIFHQCALMQDATVRCWGENDYGQLGNGVISSPPDAPNPTPVPVVGLNGVAAVAGGGFHTCARFSDGRLRCWGRNSEGQLGDPAFTDWASPTSVPVAGITTATGVTGGGYHTCAVLQNGTVRCWGQNDYGQLGDGSIIEPQTRPPTPRPTPTPVTVQGITTAVAMKSGIFHTCALLRDGTMQCWGWNDFFQLGDSTSNFNYSSVPVTVSGIRPAALAPGAEHTCVLLPDGTVRCWGDNGYGQLGNGSQRGVYAPNEAAVVTGITTAVAATSGAEHTCALLRDGRVQCWGRGLFGRLGDGRDRNSPEGDAFAPVTVVGIGGTSARSYSTVRTIE